MTKYFLCRNLECGCPIPEGQDFCDNCNCPSPLFLSPPGPDRIGSGVLLGYVEDGSEFRMRLDYIHYALYGMTKTGKTTLAMKIAVEAEHAGIRLLVIDPEGEWRNIVPLLKGKTEYYLSLSNLKVNPFELKDRGLVAMLLKETIFQQGRNDFYSFTPQMEAVLDECIGMSDSVPDLIENVRNATKDKLKTKVVNLEMTRAALLVRLRPLEENESLRQIFYCDKSTIDLANLDDRNIIIDLHDLDSKVAYSRPLRLVYNVIIVAGLVKALSKETTNEITNMVVADEAQRLVPKIFEKETATDTWVATEYAVRLRKRGYVMLLISQHPKNIEDDIRNNVHVNFIFRMQSDQNAKVVAGALGYSHYARVDHIGRILANLRFRQAIVKMPDVANPFVIDSAEFVIGGIDVNKLEVLMPKVELGGSDIEEEFLESVRKYPFITVVERRSMLRWDERRYSGVVDRLVSKGVIEKVRISLGRGGQRVLYELVKPRKPVPGIKHEFYVNWIIERLASEGVVCRAEKVGPDIQIPSTSIAINVEIGTSDVRGNIKKALQSFQKVIVCSDYKKLIQSLSDETKTQNVRCALVQDVIDVYHSMQTDDGVSVR